MSIRLQSYLSVVLALVVFLALAVGACRQAGRSVEGEMHKSLMSGQLIVNLWMQPLPRGLAATPERIRNTDVYLSRLVATFNGNRRLWAQYIVNGKVVTRSYPAAAEYFPRWFERLLDIPLEHLELPAPGDPTRVIRVNTETDHEIVSVWGQFRGFCVSLALFSLLVLGLLIMVMRRVETPLKRLGAGFDAVGGGDYAARVAPGGPTELSHLAHAFNRMAEKLDRTETANRRMSRQLLAIQEEERSELARELHDEMGPFLFAMRVDAEAIEAQARQVPHNPIMERARAVGEAVTHIQRHVRLILKQLRPTDFADFGLKAAIENLAGFWRRHVECVTINLDIADARESFGAEADTAIYRLVQEGLTNAVRHGGAKNVWITILSDGGEISVAVEDDGIGFSAAGPNADGLGLKGMRERLAVLGSELSLSVRTGGGTRLATIIRRQRARQPEPVA